MEAARVLAVFFPLCRPRRSNRISRSWTGELMLNSPPARAWISRVRAASWPSISRLMSARRARSILTPARSMSARTATRGSSIVVEDRRAGPRLRGARARARPGAGRASASWAAARGRGARATASSPATPSAAGLGALAQVLEGEVVEGVGAPAGVQQVGRRRGRRRRGPAQADAGPAEERCGRACRGPRACGPPGPRGAGRRRSSTSGAGRGSGTSSGEWPEGDVGRLARPQATAMPRSARAHRLGRRSASDGQAPCGRPRGPPATSADDLAPVRSRSQRRPRPWRGVGRVLLGQDQELELA